MRGDSSCSTPSRQTVVDQVYQALKRDIITLQHRPGRSLTEAELAASYGSSRVPVREACRRLQQEGLLTAVPYKGYFVTQISLQEIKDSFELRWVLESQAARWAWERATNERLEGLRALASTQYTYNDWSSYLTFLDQNLEFHLQFVALADNQRLVSMLGDLLVSMQRYFFLGLDLGDYAGQMRGEHERLVELLESGSSAAVVACVQRQITRSRERIVQALASESLGLPLT